MSRLHALIEYFAPYGTPQSLEILREQMNQLFDGRAAPQVTFLSVCPLEDGKLLAMPARTASDCDYEEWLAALQDYIGDRVVLIPQEC